MGFNKDKCEVLHLEQNNPKQLTKLEFDKFGSSLTGKMLKVLGDSKLTTSRQCILSAMKANHVLGSVTKTASRSGYVFISNSVTFMRPHQEYLVQFCSSQFRRDVDKIECH